MTTIPILYHEVHALLQAGEFERALARLDASPVLEPSNHHRQRAYALHNLYRCDDAYGEMVTALKHSNENQRGPVYVDWAVMYMREQRYDEGFRCYHQALALLQHADGRATALYNLAWTYLRRLSLTHAAQVLDEGQAFVRATRDANARWRMTFFRCALAMHARIGGHWHLAHDRAVQAVSNAPGDRAGVFAHHTLATTLRLRGDLHAALESQRRALDLAGDGQARDTETLHLALIELTHASSTDQDAPAQILRMLTPRMAPYDAWRARLHLAQRDLQQGDPAAALTTLQAAIDADEPFVLLDEAPVLERLYTFGRVQGLTLPTAAEVSAPSMHLTVRGAPGLMVAGTPSTLDRALPVGVLLYLHLEGPTTPADLASALLDLGHGDGKRGTARIRAAVQDIAYVTGSDALVQRDGPRLRLHPAWTVTTDLGRGGGPVLPDLYGPWVTDLSSG